MKGVRFPSPASTYQDLMWTPTVKISHYKINTGTSYAESNYITTALAGLRARRNNAETLPENEARPPVVFLLRTKTCSITNSEDKPA